MWPEGERKSGKEHGPSSDAMRLESIFCSRRGFIFPWGDKDWSCELLPPSGVLLNEQRNHSWTYYTVSKRIPCSVKVLWHFEDSPTAASPSLLGHPNPGLVLQLGCSPPAQTRTSPHTGTEWIGWNASQGYKRQSCPLFPTNGGKRSKMLEQLWNWCGFQCRFSALVTHSLRIGT